MTRGDGHFLAEANLVFVRNEQALVEESAEPTIGLGGEAIVAFEVCIGRLCAGQLELRRSAV